LNLKKLAFIVFPFFRHADNR